ncbi:hypothetical protein U9M48_002193 [Paspalum notatum var. saurae]|uniref:J domain-containing protein n=1 Tax=Paspalum notatum var. saurae TaxID=547442 RepID=A0AAQ3PGT3_PASNO
MECNREEAVRARRIAIKKLEKRDFSGAQKVALQAQRLYPELENLSQLLAVCKVYCAAEAKINRRLDWYGILQVEVTADDTTISKQYDKLVFWLHPNKNTLPGAEDAFKLVSEAHMILCDHVKRSRYNIKRQATQLSDITLAKRSGVAGRVQAYDSTVVFWIICPHCKKRFVYYRRNFLVSCDDCGKNFFAIKLNEQSVPSRFLSAPPNNPQVSPGMVSCQHHHIPDQLVQYTKPGGSMDSKLTVDSTHTDEHIKWDGNSGDYGEGSSETRSHVVQCSAMNKTHSLSPSADKGTTGSMMLECPYPDVAANQDFSREDTSTVPSAAGSCNLQLLGKRKQSDCADSSHSRDSCNNKRQNKDSSLSGANSTAEKMDNDNAAGADNQAAKHVPDTMDGQGGINATHEGSQQKYKNESTDIANQIHGNLVITYECADSYCSRDFCSNKSQMKNNSLADANLSDDKVCSDNVVGAENQAAEPVPSTLDNQDEGNETYEGSQQRYMKEGTSIADQMHGSPVVNYECPDFFDFGKLRDINRISVNQIWAVYDDHDFMPRIYAQIKHVDASNLKVQLTWLEHNTLNGQETRWTREELPVASGSFSLGKTSVLEDPSMYLSHEVSWTKGKNMNSFEIYPKMGEIWALYKESSLLQSQNTDNHQSFNYDVVEVFNVSMSVGFIVSPLVRIHGFVSLFAEAKDKSHILIPSSELLRFSHSIPCYRTDGSEKVGVGGLLELDTAALPSDLAAAFPSITLDSYMDINKKKVTQSVDVKYPDSEFHNFNEDRSCEKFNCGQVWALYSATDTFPNLYGWINKVEKEPFKVHLTWLMACPQGVNKHWLEQDIPVSCGEFGIQNLSTEYNETCAFSHLVVTRCQIGTGQQVKILPKVGEVWAIYKNWAPDWVPSSKAHPPEYAIGVIKICTKTTTLFSFLTKVDGHVSVFKHDVKGALEVPMEENLRFSHRIPAFHLTKENDGKLRGFYELDPAAVPYVLLCCPPASLRPPLAAAPTSSGSVMDCNKEEALRAKDIALNILGAQRIALRAQRLYPKLEHLPQLLTMCEVHCAAEAKVNGNMDWYGILQVEATADEIVIRKQYEKLALLLHLGKNTLPGAQSAFKLVSEAQTILCDHVKRSRYDIKRQRGSQQMSKETTWRSFDTLAIKSDGAEHTPPSDLVMVFWTACPHCWKRFVYYQQNFWIRCDGCRKNFFAFKIHEEVVPSRLLVAAPNNCQVTFEMFSRQRHGVHNPQVKFSKFYTKGKDVDSEPTMHAGQSHERVEQDCSSDGCQEVRCSGTRSEAVECSAIYLIPSPAPSINKCTTKRMVPDPPDAYCAATHNMSREYASTTLHAAGSNSLERSGKRKQDGGANNSHSGDSCNKRAKKSYGADSCDEKIPSENVNSDNVASSIAQLDEHLHSETDCQGDGNTTHDGTANSGDCEKFDDIVAGTDNQSTEHLSNKVDSQGDVKGTCEGNANSGDGKMLSDNVAGSNNQLSEHHCREMGSQGDGDATHKCNANSDTVGDRGNIKSEATDIVRENSCHSECLSLPDRNVFDFAKFRDVNLFAVGQIWALYDNRDGMPRFYARITCLDASDFKVHLAWLEHDAVNEEEEKWTDEELPVACGKFCFRKTRDISRNKSMFSHIVAWTEGEERNSYVIYPIKGDVWALYKGWSMEWSLDADNHRSYEYEVVEVLSNISADGVTVIPLVRIKGFQEKIPFTIPSSELLQFSHRIPFYRTTGDEKVGIPGGFLELDTVSLPTDLDVAFPSVTLNS